MQSPSRGMVKKPMIQDLVRNGYVTALDGARLVELRKDVQRSRQRQQLRRSPGWRIASALGAFFLILFGARRD